MNINRLPVCSDRERQTYRSENSRVVTGSLSLTTVRPTPTIHIPEKIIYWQVWERLLGTNGGQFIPEIFVSQIKTGFTRIGVVVKKDNVINVGRQLIFCIHKCSFKCVMDKNRLPVRSDRGLQTYRSENSRAVTGSLSLTTVRPTPTIHIPKKIIYLHGGNWVFRINGGLFNA
ncbi:hypothetical protein ACUMKS_003095 [Proteus mirabilis]|nr:hypothetical protein [Proteus mirabilis]MBG2747758.1 hypothetical protein [Proteus mirabilis]HCK1903545.1 hypothetical protein [Proteus mirabilis]HEJ0135691.1 hypothetical protein [Proteus mirabilis]HEJ9810622.1 hypothetical protein [Proteus mirabilis]HEK1025487.1 hypothetical protein [Proteus mirabilis]